MKRPLFAILLTASCAVWNPAHTDIAGVTAVGSTSYPSAGMTHRGELGNENQFIVSATDSVNRHVYFGTGWDSPRIIKHAIASGSTAPVRVGHLELPTTNEIWAIELDPARGVGWAAAGATIYMFGLGQGNDNPYLLGSTSLTSTGFTFISGLRLDPTGLALYVWGFDSGGLGGGLFVKMDAGTAEGLPTTAQTLILLSDEQGTRHACFDFGSNLAFISASDATGVRKLVKVDLGAGLGAMTRLSSATMTGTITSGRIWSIVRDAATGYLYLQVGTDTIRKFNPGAGAAAPSLTASLTLTGTDRDARHPIVDPSESAIYYFTESSAPRKILKIGMTTGTAAPTRISSTNLPNHLGGTPIVLSASGDSVDGVMHFGLENDVASDYLPAAIGKASFSIGSAGPTIHSYTNQVRLLPENFDGLALDPANGVLLVLSGFNQALVKATDSAAGLPPVVVGRTSHPHGSLSGFLVMNPTGTHAYVGYDSGGTAGFVGKFRLNAPASVATYLGEGASLSGELSLRYAALDAANSVLYIVDIDSPSSILMFTAPAGDALPARIGSMTVTAPESAMSGIATDGLGYLYTQISATPPRISKYRIEPSPTPPTFLGTTPLPAGHTSGAAGLVVDATTGLGYMTAIQAGVPVLVKFSLGAGDALPTYEASGALDASDGILESVAIDSTRQEGYVGVRGGLVRFALGAGSAVPVRLARLGLLPADQRHARIVVDSARGRVHVGGDGSSNGDAARLHTITTAPKDAVHATRITLPADAGVTSVNMHIHEPGANIRMAIYSADPYAPQLLWESPPVAALDAETTLSIPIPSGTPGLASLLLTAGDYWLAWNSDTPVNAGSFAAAAAGSSFIAPASFAAMPSRIPRGNRTEVAGQWTQWLEYGPPGTSVAEWQLMD